MATGTGESTEDPFLKKTGIIRQNLEESFREYQLSLQQRKEELTAILDTAEREYTASRVEYKQKLKAIEQIQTSIKQQTVSFKSMENSLLAEMDRQKLQIIAEHPERSIELILDSTFNEKIQTLGEIEVITHTQHLDALVESSEMLEERTELEATPSEPIEPEIKRKTEQKALNTPPLTARDYNNKTDPIVSAVKQGDRPCDLKYPQRVAVDSKTVNIFIADQTSHSVKIYSQEGEYLDNVQHNNTIKRGPSEYANKVELVHPYGVCFYRDSLYVTSLMEQKSSLDIQPCVFKFVRDSKSDNKFFYSRSNGIHGPYENLFKRPSFISADQENGDVYVCEEACRVQVLDKNLNYKRLLTSYSNIADLQVTEDRVYLLFAITLRILSKQSGTVIKHFQLSYREAQLSSSAMYIDTNSFFILNGIEENEINVIQQSDKPETRGYRIDTTNIQRSFRVLSSLLTQHNPADDGRFEVRGITADESTQRIIVVFHSKDNMLQIY